MKKILIALALSACMAFSIIGFTACEGTPGKSAYDIWIEQGNTGTEQDFLNSLKGSKGDPGDDGAPGAAGKSAYQAWLDAGNTGDEQDFLDSLVGESGTTPEITISDDGYWEIDGVKTDQKAQGESGKPGENGNKITHGEGAPTVTEGANEGDMYVDTNEWNVYFFESGSWKNYGSIKSGGDEPVPPASDPSVTVNSVPVSGSTTVDISDLGLEQDGAYIAEMDMGAQTIGATSRLYAQISGTYTEFEFSESRTAAAGEGHNIYIAFFDISYATSFTLSNAETSTAGASGFTNLTITFKKYVAPTLKADGVPVEIPINPVQYTGAGEAVKYKIKLDSSITNGAYKCTFTLLSDKAGSGRFQGLTSGTYSLSAKNSGKEQDKTFSGLSTSEENYCYIEKQLSETEHTGYFIVLYSLVPAAA